MARTVRGGTGSVSSTTRRRRLTSRVVMAALATAVLILGVVWAVMPAAAGTWLRNLGFEQGLTYWTYTQPSAGNVVVVGSEGPSQWGAYKTMNITVSPRSGAKMLRLGIPKDISTKQIKGTIQAKQVFTSETRDIEISYRVFTYEHRSTDVFTIDLTDSTGAHYGSVGGKPLPYKPTIPVPAVGKYYYDATWKTVTITGVPAGKTLTLSYTLSNTISASHDTWIYIDHLNKPPVPGTVTITPDPARTNDLLTATPSGFTDPDGDALTYRYQWSKNGTAISGATGTTLDLSKAGNGDVGDTISVSCKAFDGQLESTAATDSLVVQNTPPVAEFTWAPGGPGGEAPHEGDVVGLYGDRSTDDDGSADIVKWEWHLSNGSQSKDYNPITGYKSPVGFVVPDKEGTYTVKLKVTDKAGDTSEITKTIEIQNAKPRVNALNIEVLPGDTARLFGRFIDPGWSDGHTALWTPASGDALTGKVTEDHKAAIASGMVTGSFKAGTTLGDTEWTLGVDDGSQTGTDSFKVSVIAPDSNRFEDQDTLPNVHSLEGDGAYLSYIQTQGDIDLYEVKLPGGGLLPQGTEVLATLRDLPADYDLAVFEGTTGSGSSEVQQTAPFLHSAFDSAAFLHSPFLHSAFLHSAFLHSPLQDAAFLHSPFLHSAYLDSGYINSPLANSPFLHSPFSDAAFLHSPFTYTAFLHSGAPSGWTQLDGYPLSDMSYLGNTSGNTSGTDISFEELGFDLQAMQNLRVLGFSANTGLGDEAVLATAGYPQTTSVQGHVYVAVKSANGAFSLKKPYTLQLETSRPEDVLASTETPQDPLVTSPTSSTVVVKAQAAPLTLFVTQFERLTALYPAGSTSGDPNDGATIVKNALLSVADRADVKGKVVSVAGNLYTDWDVEPWRVDLANVVAGAIRNVIQDQLAANPSIKYVVLVGDDRVVPARRLVDQTAIGNEQEYLNSSFMTAPSATLASIARGYVLTDDYYADKLPIAWGGSSIYVPDLAVSRLVEKPAEIAGAIQAFKDANGILSANVGVVSGYDFMADGALAVKNTLAGAGMSVTNASGLISDAWHGTQLWDALNAGVQIADINAHFTHFAGISAYGYSQSVAGEDYSDTELVTSKAVAAAGSGSLFKGRLVFSMGCHSGLSVPDEQAVELPADSPIDVKLDLPQAMMRQGGLYVGSSGYGYGDTEGIAGTEALIGDFAREMVGGTGSSTGTAAASIGLALAQAKQQYFSTLSAVTPYDQKSSVEFTMYGMPQYKLAVGGATAAKTASTPAATGTPLNGFRLVFGEKSMDSTWTAATLDHTYALTLETVDAGQYVAADGQYEATPERPVHPVVTNVLAARTQGPAHGVVFTAGTYSDRADFDPVISRPGVEWEVGADEFQVAPSGFWPADPGVLTTIQTPAGFDQKLVIVPAQFKASSTDPKVVGTERVWSSLQAEVLRSVTPATGADWLAPTVSGIDFWVIGTKANVSIAAKDASGISRIVVLQMGPTSMFVPVGGDVKFTSGPNGEGGRYDLTLDLTGIDLNQLALYIQVVDGKGNVTGLTGRGASVGLTPGLQNPGFEAGMRFWSILSQAEPDNVEISGTDANPDVSISPYDGAKMLILGGSRTGSNHQAKGLTTVGQTFLSDGSPIYVAYRILTEDWRIRDALTVDVKDTTGASVGKMSSSLTGAAAPLPVVVKTAGFNNNQYKYWDSGWVVATITEVPANKVVTLSYTLMNQTDGAQPTWLYFDAWTPDSSDGYQ